MKHTVFSDLYDYAGGQKGLTICSPLWSNDRITFYGAYCLDVFPSAASNFVRRYYDTKDGLIVNYMLLDLKDDLNQADIT